LVHFRPFWYIAPRKIWQPCFVSVFPVVAVKKTNPRDVPWRRGLVTSFLHACGVVGRSNPARV
jgi:hypothetical protein